MAQQTKTPTITELSAATSNAWREYNKATAAWVSAQITNRPEARALRKQLQKAERAYQRAQSAEGYAERVAMRASWPEHLK